MAELKYIVMILQRWDKITALTPMPQRIAPMDESVGFLLVYDSVEKLRAQWPEATYLTVEPVEAHPDLLSSKLCPSTTIVTDELRREKLQCLGEKGHAGAHWHLNWNWPNKEEKLHGSKKKPRRRKREEAR
jgi:hypothetical protein